MKPNSSNTFNDTVWRVPIPSSDWTTRCLFYLPPASFADKRWSAIWNVAFTLTITWGTPMFRKSRIPLQVPISIPPNNNSNSSNNSSSQIAWAVVCVCENLVPMTLSVYHRIPLAPEVRLWEFANPVTSDTRKDCPYSIPHMNTLENPIPSEATGSMLRIRPAGTLPENDGTLTDPLMSETPIKVPRQELPSPMTSDAMRAASSLKILTKLRFTGLRNTENSQATLILTPAYSAR